MINYIKWLFRTKLVNTHSGKIVDIGSLNATRGYTFFCYSGRLGKSWEFVGSLNTNLEYQDLSAFQLHVKPWLES